MTVGLLSIIVMIRPAASLDTATSGLSVVKNWGNTEFGLSSMNWVNVPPSLIASVSIP